MSIYLRFAPVSSDADVTLYWIRTNALGSDNAAIQNTALDTQYRWAMGKCDVIFIDPLWWLFLHFDECTTVAKFKFYLIVLTLQILRKQYKVCAVCFISFKLLWFGGKSESERTYPLVCINHHRCRFYSRGYKSIKTFSRAKRKPQVLGALILFHFISRRHFPQQ